MHNSDTNIPKIICGFHSKELGYTQILQTRNLKDFKSCKSLERKIHFSALRGQLKFHVF